MRIDHAQLRALAAVIREGSFDRAAQSLNVTPSAISQRVKALEDSGVIRQQVTLLAPEVLGLDVNVFIHVSLEKQVEQSLHRFEEEIAERPEVMECYLMTGDPDYLLRVLLPSIQALERFLDYLTRLPGVANIRSSFAL